MTLRTLTNEVAALREEVKQLRAELAELKKEKPVGKGTRNAKPH